MTPTLAPPPAPARTPAPPPARPRAAKPVPRREQDRAYGRALRWSLAASVVVHLVVLVLSPAFLRVGAPPGATDTPFDPVEAPGLRGVELAPVASRGAAGPAPATASPADAAPAARRPPLRPTRAPPAPPAAAAQAPRTSAPAVASPAAPSSGGEDALRPGFRDRRLYIAPRELPPPPEPTAEQLHARYMAHLQSRIDAYNDSIGVLGERERRAKDWTYTDKNGRKWGADDGKIYLGGIQLPGNAHALDGGDGEKKRAAEEETRTRDEIARDEAVRAQRDNFKERTRATRERKERERQSKPPVLQF